MALFRFGRRLITSALICALALAFGLATSSAEAQQATKPKAAPQKTPAKAKKAPKPIPPRHASYIIEAKTGHVLHDENADMRTYPASLTKIMTLYMAFEALEDGRLTLGRRIKVSAHAAHQAPSRLGLNPGQTLTVEQAILAMVTKSANDAAVAMGEALGGSEANFALQMTQKARALGMHNTVFRNASGLPNPQQVTTARDMASLGRAVLTRFPKQYRYFSTEHFTFNDQVHKNHNALLTTSEGVDGIKTGYIRASGFNLVASAERDGRRVIAVVMGGTSPTQRNDQMAELLDAGFEKLDRLGPAIRTAQAAKVKPAASVPASEFVSGEGDAGDPGRAWGIQVGAFVRKQQAEDAAHAALLRAQKALTGGEVSIASQINAKKVTLHRARVVGLTHQQAAEACRTLRAQKSECLELNPGAVQIASAR